MSSSADNVGTLGSLLGRCLVALGRGAPSCRWPTSGRWARAGRCAPTWGSTCTRSVTPAWPRCSRRPTGGSGRVPASRCSTASGCCSPRRPGSRPRSTPSPIPPTCRARLASWSLGAVHAAVEYVLDLDLDAPAPRGIEPVVIDETAGEVLTLSPTLADFSLLILAGPGVVRSGHVEGLQELARLTGAGVLNTWGAKGVFPWNDPHHFGTGGMQARYFELAGFDEAELVIATGIDPLESPAERWAGRWPRCSRSSRGSCPPWPCAGRNRRRSSSRLPSTASCRLRWRIGTRATTSPWRRRGLRPTCRRTSPPGGSSPPMPARPDSGSPGRSRRWPPAR